MEKFFTILVLLFFIWILLFAISMIFFSMEEDNIEKLSGYNLRFHEIRDFPGNLKLIPFFNVYYLKLLLKQYTLVPLNPADPNDYGFSLAKRHRDRLKTADKLVFEKIKKEVSDCLLFAPAILLIGCFFL